MWLSASQMVAPVVTVQIHPVIDMSYFLCASTRQPLPARSVRQAVSGQAESGCSRHMLTTQAFFSPSLLLAARCVFWEEAVPSVPSTQQSWPMWESKKPSFLGLKVILLDSLLDYRRESRPKKGKTVTRSSK